MTAIITDQKQARKLAMNIAGEILQNQLLTLPVHNYVHPSCSCMVFKELQQIAAGLKKRAKNIDAGELEDAES